jgi:hypothetical protein
MQDAGKYFGYFVVGIVGFNLLLYLLIWIAISVFAFSFSNWFLGILITAAVFMVMIHKLKISIPFTKLEIKLVSVFPKIWLPLTTVLIISSAIYWCFGENMVKSMVRYQITAKSLHSFSMDQAEREKKLFLAVAGAPLYNKYGGYVRSLNEEVYVYNTFEKEENHGEVMTKIMLPDKQGRFILGDEIWIVEADLIPKEVISKEIVKKQQQAEAEKWRLAEIAARVRERLAEEKKGRDSLVTLKPGNIYKGKYEFSVPEKGRYKIISPKSVIGALTITVNNRDIFVSSNEKAAVEGFVFNTESPSTVIKFITSGFPGSEVPELILKKT